MGHASGAPVAGTATGSCINTPVTDVPSLNAVADLHDFSYPLMPKYRLVGLEGEAVFITPFPSGAVDIFQIGAADGASLNLE